MSNLSSPFHVSTQPELDNFLAETTQNMPSVEIHKAVQIDTPLVTTTIVGATTSTPAMMTGPREGSSSIPPWLASQTLKRKKQAISPNDFDFGQLVLVKTKSTKKPKTLWRVLVDKASYKYVEVAQPPPGKTT